LLQLVRFTHYSPKQLKLASKQMRDDARRESGSIDEGISMSNRNSTAVRLAQGLTQLLVLTLVAALTLGQWPAAAYAATKDTRHTPAFRAALAAPAPAGAPLAFVPNAGQFDPAVSFQAQGGGATLAFGPQAVTIALPQLAGEPEPALLTLRWDASSSAPSIAGLRRLPGVANYAFGSDPANWRQGLSTYGELLYSGLYHGVDLHYSGVEGALKSSYFVAPGADPSAIRLRYAGATALSLDEDGSLLIALPRTSATSAPRVLSESAPIAWQDIAGRRQLVPVRYALHADGSVGFALGAYDARAHLVIDPALVYGTYLGGAGNDRAEDVAVDASGNAYVVGVTTSPSFPASSEQGGAVAIANSGPNVVVTKLISDGTSIAYTTVLAGDGEDRGFGIAVNPATGVAYIAGETNSANFPRLNAFQPDRSSGFDAFVARLNADGSLSYSSYFGGNATDSASDIALDPATGAVTIVGATNSESPAPFNTTAPLGYKGGTDAFVARISAAPALSALRYLGGTNNEAARGVALDGAGNAYIVGETQSANFGATPGVIQNSLNNASLDAFVVKAGPANEIVYSTYLGGGAQDLAYAVAVNPGGEAYVVGETESTNFYTTTNAFQPGRQGNDFDAFVAQLSADAGSVLYGSYLGGLSGDQANAVALDGEGSIYIAGETASTGTFPLLDPFPAAAGGFLDAFVVKVLPSGQRDYGSFLGGSGGRDAANGVAFSPADNSVYVVGYSASNELYTAGATPPLQPNNAGGEDAFVAKLSQPIVSIGDAEVLEGTGAGTTLLSFPVTLSLTSTQALTLTYSTVDGSATAGSDYTAATGAELSIPAGALTGTVDITITRDTTYELSETLTLSATQVAGGTLAPGSETSTGTILNDDIPPSISGFAGTTQAEGNSGTTPFTFTVTLSEISGVDAVFSYLTEDITATAASDYLTATEILTITAGAISTTFTVGVNGDALFENDEDFGVTLTPIADITAAGSVLTATSTITNDDQAPTIQIGDLAQNEGNSGSSDFVFPLTISAVSGLDAVVDFELISGTATVSDSDFVDATGTITIPAGATTGALTVTVNGDTKLEADETFFVSMSVVSGLEAVDSDLSATGTITNDDLGPSFTIDDTGGLEGDSGTTPLSFTVTLSEASGLPATVFYETADGSATSSGAAPDFTGVTSTTLSIPAGAISGTFSIAVTGDTIFENDETFTVTLTAGPGTRADGSDLSATGTITNDDAPPEIGVGPFSQAEGSGGGTTDFLVPLTISGTSELPITFAYTTTDGTASDPDDYAGVEAQSVTLPAGASSGTLTVSVVADNVFEADETLSVTIGSPTNASILTATAAVTITNDDGAPTVAIGDFSQAEGNAGTSSFQVPLIISGTSELSITLAYTTTNGSATAGSDYSAATSTSVTIPAGATSGVLTVTVNGDTLFEADETLSLTIGSPTNASILTDTATVTITNDDLAPTVAIGDIGRNEGNSGTTNFVFTATLDAASSLSATVDFETASDSALSEAESANFDYTAISGTLTFLPGETTKAITVAVRGDTTFENDETFRVLLSPTAGISITGNTLVATGTITNDDTPPDVELGNLARLEGNSGTTNFVLPLTVTGSSALSITLAYTTTNGTATAGSDYSAASGALITLPPFASTGSLTISVNGDTSFEADETLSVTIGSAVGASILTGTAAVTITNDDTPPRIGVGRFSQAEGNAGTSSFQVPLIISGTSQTAITLAYTTTNGSATAGSDYSAETGSSVTIPAGATSGVLTVTVNGDTLFEADETLSVTIGSAVGASILTDTATVTITNDDLAPTAAISNTSVVEGNSGTATASFSVTLSAASSIDAVLAYATADLSATVATGDYTAASGTLTIPAGSTSGVITVSVNGDTLFEADEIFNLELTPVSGLAGSPVTQIAQGTIVNDDTAPTFSVGDRSLNEGNSGTTSFAFPVTLSAVSGLDARIAYLSQNGSASAPSDFSTVSGTLTIPAGQTTGSITVSVLGDTTLENDEVFGLELSPISGLGGSPVPQNAQGTILNDDIAPEVNIGDVSQNEQNSGTTLFSFPVTLTEASGVTATVTFSTSAGLTNPATAGSDYTGATGSVTFLPGETGATIVISVTGDTADELDETFRVLLTGGTNALDGDKIIGVGTILNDDNPEASVGDASVTEGDSGTTAMNFPVSLSAATADAVTVNYAVSAGSASEGVDFEAQSGTLSFVPGGATVQTITVNVIGDALDEPDETLILELTGASGAGLGDASGTGTIIDDDASPAANPDVYNHPEDTTLVVTAGAGVLANDNDADGDALTAQLVSRPVSGTLILNTDGAFNYTPNPNFFGTDGFSYRTLDVAGNQSNVVSVTITVTAVPDPPLANDDSATTGEEQPVTIDVLANDSDPDGQGNLVPSTVRLTSSTPVGLEVSINPTTGAITVTPGQDLTGEVALTYEVCDSQGLCDTAIVTITITPTNDGPIAGDDVLTTAEDTPLSVAAASLLANDSDVDDTTLTIASVSASSTQGGQVSLIGTTVVYTPAANFFGSDSFTYTVSDGEATDEGTVTVSVSPINDRPIALPDAFRVDANSNANVLAVLANDSDLEGDTLTITAVTPPANGSVTIGSGGVSYTPNAGFEGVERFSYTISDGNGGTATANVRVTVGPYKIFLPVVMNLSAKPDLTASVSISPAVPVAGSPVQVNVIVTNNGTAATTGTFWVDLYVNPSRTPTVNTPWNEICGISPCFGVAWQVTQPLQPGQSVTLTSTPSSYFRQNTIWPGYLIKGSNQLYVLADSWNRAGDSSAADPNGAVPEQDETNNLASQPLTLSQSEATSEPATATLDARRPEDLPQRRLP
jgi:hypothetical protein